MKSLFTAGLVALLGLPLSTAAASGAPRTFPSSAGALTVETFATGLVRPWGLAFLPGGRLLVTERPGRMRIVAPDGKLSPPVAGLPKIYAYDQVGLADVALDRGYDANHVIYFCYTEPSGRGGEVALARAQLDDEGAPRLEGVQVIFHQQGPVSTGLNHGCRIAQARDGNLFLTLGDHYFPRDEAQNLSNHIGKIIRIAADGTVPADNPFIGRPDARPEIWSYGHRNPQGLLFHPQTGKLWQHEHGPRGGDEVNIIEKGRNYGWPVIGYGTDYSGAKIHAGTHRDGMEQPLRHWTPSIAPSGMTFYDGDLFPAWRGNLIIGSLERKMLLRLEVNGETLGAEERLLRDLDRIRDVRQGPDGALWLLTDNSAGRILRVVPAK
ncbi:MAG: aldose sugar dehydrogenase [Alphaproteobacteria bacterium]|jgi:glucose/arabinose dehydrogenase|nr:aldose sugar dehydrogenase [Alphaproteobacteria bacterium]